MQKKVWEPTCERIQLDELYEKHNLTTNCGKGCEHYDRCQKSCLWVNAERPITPPTGAYVGDEYTKYRILFVGINTNQGSADSEEFYSCYDWISNEHTDGSLRIAGVIHRFVRLFCGESLSPELTKKLFAFTNVIKCSVKDEAGSPTTVMNDNCRMRLRVLFQELEILKPRTVVCIGSDPFAAMLYEFIASAEQLLPGYKPWAFKVINPEYAISVIRLLNPGKGHQSVNGLQKRLISGSIKVLPVDWRYVLVDGDDKLEQIRRRADGDPQFRSAMILPGNFLYELLVERLIAYAKSNSA